MLWIGLGLYLGGIELAVWRAFRRLAIERNIAAVVVAAILLPSFELTGLGLLVAVDVALFVMLLAEHLRLEREYAGIGPQSEPSE